jgi:CHAT domain-containing protein
MYSGELLAEEINMKSKLSDTDSLLLCEKEKNLISKDLPISNETRSITLLSVECEQTSNVAITYKYKKRVNVTPILKISHYLDKVDRLQMLCSDLKLKKGRGYLLENLDIAEDWFDLNNQFIGNYHFEKKECKDKSTAELDAGMEEYRSLTGLAAIISGDPDHDQLYKVKMLLTLIEEADKKLTNQQMKFFMGNVEHVLFEDYTDPKIQRRQLTIILHFISRKDFWAPAHTRDEFTTRFKYLARNDLFGNEALEDFSLNLIKLNEFVEIGNYDKAQELNELNKVLIDSQQKSQKITVEVAKGMKYYLEIADFRIAFNRGDLVLAGALANNLDEKLESFINESKSNPSSLENYSIILKSPHYLDYDFAVGRYDRVIKRISQILEVLPEKDLKPGDLRSYADLYNSLYVAYKSIGDKEKESHYQKKVSEINATTGSFNITNYITYFLLAMDEEDYAAAYKWVENLEFASNYAEAISKNQFKEFVLLQKQFLAESESTKTAEKKKIIEKKFYFKFAKLLELDYLINLQSKKNPTADLSTFEYLYTTYQMAGEKEYAAFYARKYINNLQGFRGQLISFNRNDQSALTKKSEDMLKKFSENFFEIGDYKSSLVCFQIIKEVQFLDFIRRKNLDDDFLSKVNISDKENDFYKRLENISKDIKLLSMQMENVAKDNEFHDALAKELVNKKIKFDKLHTQFADYLHSNTKPQLTKNKLPTDSISLGSHEASIQYLINPESVFSVVAIKGEVPKSFTYKIKQTKLRLEISEIQNQLTHKEILSSKKLNDLSEIFIKDQLTFIKDKGIKNIKLKTDDFLSLLPVSILRFDDTDVGELYNIEIASISKQSKKIKTSPKQVDIYGASKGNNQFSSLPGVREEVGSIMRLPSVWKRNNYLDEDFTKLNLINSFDKNSALIHLATHFRSFGNDAMSTQMLLGDGSVMSLLEMQNNIPSFSTDLLTLSACDTGAVIPAASGFNNEGLSNVFQLKGAKNVISTLWSIDDKATAKFMLIFYNIYLNNKISASEALKITQSIFRTSTKSAIGIDLSFPHNEEIDYAMNEIKKYQHPYYWAGFQLSTIN